MEIIDNNNVVVDVVVDYLMCECSFVSKFDIHEEKINHVTITSKL